MVRITSITNAPRIWFAAAVMALCAVPAHAVDLMAVWQAAQAHDPQGAVADAGRAAGAAYRAQAAALWRPTVELTASAGVAGASSHMRGAQFSAPGFGQSNGVAFGTSIDAGTSTRWALSARQPLYNPQRDAQREQLHINAGAADIAWQQARQDWMLQTAQRYFDGVMAEQQWAVLRRQLVSVEKALVEAKDRYDLGDKPVTDLHESAARARGLQAQLVAAANEVQLARSTLSDITGLAVEALTLQAPSQASAPRSSVLGDAQPSLLPLDHWLAWMSENNPALKSRMAQVTLAEQEVKKLSLAASTTVDLVAQAGAERLGGSGDYGSARNQQRQHMVGVVLTVPLYTGGLRTAKLQEALRMQDKARAEVEQTRLQLVQSTRRAWLALQSGHARLGALGEALAASQSRLDATRLGQTVGDRTTMDLLNAENDASAAALALLQVRVDLLLSRLRLDALAGQLGDAQLATVNSSLQP